MVSKGPLFVRKVFGRCLGLKDSLTRKRSHGEERRADSVSRLMRRRNRRAEDNNFIRCAGGPSRGTYVRTSSITERNRRKQKPREQRGSATGRGNLIARYLIALTISHSDCRPLFGLRAIRKNTRRGERNRRNRVFARFPPLLSEKYSESASPVAYVVCCHDVCSVFLGRTVYLSFLEMISLALSRAIHVLQPR